MDNISVVVAQHLLKILDGAKPEAEQLELLANYFGQFTKSAGRAELSSGSSEVLVQFRELLGGQQFADQWRARVANPADANAFIRSSVIRLHHQRLNVTSQRMGLTHVAQYGVTDFVYERVPGRKRWELHLMVEGKCLYQEGENSHILSPGSVALIPPDCFIQYQRAEGEPAWSHYWALFSPKPDWLEWCGSLSQKRHLQILELSTDVVSDLISHFDHSIALVDSIQGKWGDRILTNRVESLLLDIMRNQTQSSKGIDPRIQRALSFIQGHYRETWTLNELANHCHLSPARFSVLFKKNLGISPMLWRDHMRMREARHALQETSIPIAQIAETIGYRDALYFSRRFHELTGVSPRQFRSRAEYY